MQWLETQWPRGTPVIIPPPPSPLVHVRAPVIFTHQSLFITTSASDHCPTQLNPPCGVHVLLTAAEAVRLRTHTKSSADEARFPRQSFLWGEKSLTLATPEQYRWHGLPRKISPSALQLDTHSTIQSAQPQHITQHTQHQQHHTTHKRITHIAVIIVKRERERGRERGARDIRDEREKRERAKKRLSEV